MGTNFTVFESAVSALAANNQALSITANNIANVNTPGYSRQQIVLASRAPQTAGSVELGLGVDLKSILRTVDRFAELRLQESETNKAEYDALVTNIQQIETAFNEVGRDGLSKSITDFFNAFHDVANDPDSTSARDTVVNQGNILIDRFASLTRSLADARRLIDGDVQNKVDRINALATEINQLNLQISTSDAASSLTLRDQRQIKVREISSMVNVTSVETSDGIFQLYIGQGFQLVNGERSATLGTMANTDNDGHLDITLRVGNGAPANITNRLVGGSLKGSVDARDTYISGYQDTMDQLAYSIATELNNVHAAGYDLDGNTLVEFFDESSFNTEAATGTDLATGLHDADGDHLRIAVGDVITFSGTVTGAIGGSLTVTGTTTVNDIATALQTAIQAAGAGTETVTVRPDGSLRVTAGATAITNLQLSITGKANFNAAFDYASPIASAGTGDSSALTETVTDGASRLLVLSAAVTTNVRSIAASSTAAGLPGDNTNALAMANLQTQNIGFPGGDTPFINYYSGLLSQIGNDSSTFQSRFDFADAVYRQSEVQREKISGVSLEEEQLNIIRYQSAFQAAGRLVDLAKQVLDILVNIGN